MVRRALMWGAALGLPGLAVWAVTGAVWWRALLGGIAALSVGCVVLLAALVMTAGEAVRERIRERLIEEAAAQQHDTSGTTPPRFVHRPARRPPAVN